MSDKFIAGFQLGSVEFDPVEKAGLSQSQTKLMEPLLVVVRRLVDGNGLKIVYAMDFWIAAQIISGMFNGDGTARTPEEILYKGLAE